MSGGTSIKDIFFQECEDLTDALVEGLAEMAEGSTDPETVNAVFRAVHSIKGSGGAFGLTDLVSFAHKFETVLDAVRSGSLEVTPPLMRVLQRAGDILTDLIDDARNETPSNTEAIEGALQALREFLPSQEDAADEDVEFVFEPVVIMLDAPAAPDSQNGFEITFRPTRALYDCGNDPLYLLNALGELGELTATVDLSGLPDDVSEMDWEENFLTWTILLTTPSTEPAVREVFDFVLDLCEFDIRPTFSDVAESHVPSDDGPVVVADNVAVPQPDTAEGATPDLKKNSSETLAAKPGNAGEKASKESRATLRVDLERVDRLINAVGELIINQAVIAQRIEDAGLASSSDLLVDLEDYKLLAREIQEGVMAIRAQPVKSLFQRMARIVREVSEATGKSVQFITEGEDTEVDKTVVERLADPLTHMIRNAIDHGIERPEKRVAAGKEASGTVRLSAQHRSGNVLIEITDDGAGLNRERIKEIAISKGIIPPDSDPTISEIDNLLFAPGFSTAAEVTNLSGRGVGMDVVKTAIVSLGGRIAISSTPGKGSTFSISLPLTLAVMDGMVINVGDQTMVVPISSILETIRPTPRDLSRIGVGEPLLSIRGNYVPVIDLAKSLGHPHREIPLTEQVLILVRTEKLEQCALAVDAISDQRQVVIKSLEGNYGSIPGVSAATILGDGKIALIIDPDGIAASVAASPQIGEKPHISEFQHA